MVKKIETGRRESGLYMYLHVHVHQKIYADMNVFMDRIHLNKDKYWNVRTIQHHLNTGIFMQIISDYIYELHVSNIA